MKPVAAAVLLLAAATTVARAETTLCINITSLPATITAPGSYCLKQDLATTISSGTAISIEANNVTVDLNGFRLGGMSGGPATTALGVVSFKDNITVRNGTIRGYRTNIQLSGNNLLVEDMRIDNARGTGILVAGKNTVVRNNQVYRTGTPEASLATAISVLFGPTQISGNSIGGVGGVVANGILVTSGDSVIVQGNAITDVNGSSTSIGIRTLAGARTMIGDNVLSNPLAGSKGILAGGSNEGCFNNMISSTYPIATEGCETSVGNQTF
jgi:hypothetical protein